MIRTARAEELLPAFMAIEIRAWGSSHCHHRGYVILKREPHSPARHGLFEKLRSFDTIVWNIAFSVAIYPNEKRKASPLGREALSGIPSI